MRREPFYLNTQPAFFGRATLLRLWVAVRQDPALVEATKVFLAQRLLLSLVAAIFAWLVLPTFPHPWALDPHFLPTDSDPLLAALVAPWQRWDTEHFLQIAANGYNNYDGNTVFAPLFPLLTGVLGCLLFSHYMLAGLIIGNAAYYIALVYLYKLADRLFDAKTAHFTLRFLAFFPTAFFLLCAYTDSLYLALALAAFYYAQTGRWRLVALCLALASLTRIQGAILVLPLLYLYLKQANFQLRRFKWEGWLVLLAPGSFGLYLGYVFFILRDSDYNRHLEQVWGVKMVTPWASLVGGISRLGEEALAGELFYNLFNLALILIFGYLILRWLWRRLPLAYFLYAAPTLLLFLTRQKDGDLWMSMARYVLALFPAFMLVAWRIDKPGYRTALFALGAFFQTLFVILFLLWKWVA